MVASELVSLQILDAHSPRSLVKALKNADVPEAVIRELSAQSLYLAIKEMGFASSVDIILAARDEQVRMLLDFDLWQKDEFNEEAFWEWLEISEGEDDLSALQKTVRSLDLKLVALLIHRYVSVINKEEPTDAPPNAGYYTPDQGYTWISVSIEDPTRNFRFNKLLALLYETSTDLFYQLLATQTITTPSQLEEESYQDKLKRLSSEGIPDATYANTFFEFGSLNEIRELYADGNRKPIDLSIAPAPAILFEDFNLEPFTSAIRRARDSEVILQEYTLVLNAAIVRWGVDFSDIAAVKLTAEKVKGAINIALQRAAKAIGADPEAILSVTGIQPLLKYGFSVLQEIRSQARKVRTSFPASKVEPAPKKKNYDDNDGSEGQAVESWQQALIEFCIKPFPSAPDFAIDEPQSNASLAQQEVAIQTEMQLENVKKHLSMVVL